METACTDRLFNNLERLISAGIDPDDAVDIAISAASRYDKNRKAHGKRNGALGHIGCAIYHHLACNEGGDHDANAFSSYRCSTVEELAEWLGHSNGAIDSALRRLVEHGFVERKREGRGFRLRPLVPDIALTEFAEEAASCDGPKGSGAYEHYRLLRTQLLALYAPQQACPSG